MCHQNFCVLHVAASSSDNPSQNSSTQAPTHNAPAPPVDGVSNTSQATSGNTWSSLRAAAQGIFRNGTQDGLDDAISSVQDDIAEGRTLISDEFDEHMSEANKKRRAEDHFSHDFDSDDSEEDMFGGIDDP